MTMTDPNVALRKFLTDNNVDNVYGLDLPPSFDPATGTGITVVAEGGAHHAEIIGFVKYRMKVRVWAGQHQFEQARATYHAVQQLLHGVTKVDLGADGFIVSCLEVVAGQDVTDPEAGWSTVVAFYEVTVRPIA